LDNSQVILAAINTDDLEYAPSISLDQREIFFTRLALDTLTTSLYRSERSDINLAWSPPLKLTAISGFVEGAVLSPDEKSLYYHRLNESTGKFEIYRVTRP
jgi:hypothetical protein